MYVRSEVHVFDMRLYSNPRTYVGTGVYSCVTREPGYSGYQVLITMPTYRWGICTYRLALICRYSADSAAVQFHWRTTPLHGVMHAFLRASDNYYAPSLELR